MKLILQNLIRVLTKGFQFQYLNVDLQSGATQLLDARQYPKGQIDTLCDPVPAHQHGMLIDCSHKNRIHIRKRQPRCTFKIYRRFNVGYNRLKTV